MMDILSMFASRAACADADPLILNKRSLDGWGPSRILPWKGRGTKRNGQVAMSPGHGCAVRGTAHLPMVEGYQRPKMISYADTPPPPPSAAVPLPQTGEE